MNGLPDTNAAARPLTFVIQLGKIDSAIARCLAERKRGEELLNAKQKIAREVKHQRDSTDAVFRQKRLEYQRGEREIRDEQEKLTQRRKALSTLNNYKVQQSAEREIESHAQALRQREDTLLTSLQEVDDLEAQLKTLALKAESALQEHAALEEETKQLFATLRERVTAYEAERKTLIVHLDAPTLKLYERTRARYPADCVVEIKNGSCVGCFMSVGPQTVLQIHRGEKLVQCPGCGRIVFTAPASEDER